MPFRFRYHANITVTQTPRLFLIIIISHHKPAFLRQKVPHTIPSSPVHTLPTHSKLSVSRRRDRHTRTATPGTNLRRRAERPSLGTLGPTNHARRPRTEPRAAGSSACGNVGGAFVAARVTFAAKCAGGCESRGGGEA